MKKHLVLCVSLLSLAITGCKDDVVFDQKTYDEMVKKAFVVENVDPDHQWATMGAAEATVSVNTGTGDQYKVMIYDGDPIASKGTLKLLGEGKVTDGSSLDMKISYPMAKAYAYVTLFDSQNYMSVFPALIENGRLKVAVNNTQSKKASVRRAGITSVWTFSDMPTDADFPTSLPASYVTDADANGGGQGVNVVIQSSYISYLNLWNAGTNIYFPAGEWTVAGQYVGANSHVYLLPGAHVTFTGEYNLNSAPASMHIAQGATFDAGSISYNFYLYNRGTVTTSKMTQYAEGKLINEGTVNISQNLKIANKQSEVINAGTLTCASMSVEGSSHFQNLGTMTVSGETTVNSNDCSWVNNGTYTTGRFVYTAGSTDVINNCKLICTELFRINLGDTDKNSFQMNGGASVVTRLFEAAGPTFIKMGSNSLFHVTETAKFSINKDVYGIYGPETGADALFQAKTIERLNSWETNQGFSANYFGHLYVACDSHFAFGYSDKSAEQQAAGEVGNQPYYRLDAASGAKMTAYNGAKVTLSDEGCGAAYTGNPDEGEHPSIPLSYRYCFEDNFPDVGDYDFNDVVLTVTPSVNDRTLTVQVSLDAVGATKTIAAAMRLMGVQKDDLESYEVVTGFPSPDNQGLGTYNNIDTDKTFLPENEAPNNSSSMVVVLFKDAHWAMNPVKASTGGVQRLFYNTVDRKEGEHNSANVDPVVATYTFVFKDADKANTMLAQNLYDVFIVQPYGGGFWEVHTVQNGFKTAQVVTPIKPAGYAEAYGSNMPWAIVVPGDFKYPIEWKVIGARKNGTLEGAYETPGHSFAEWAEDSSQATDWYLYPTAGSVYE